MLHRVTAADAGSVTCCGDAQCTLERGVAREQIVAVTEAFSRRGTRWISSENWLYRVYWQTWLAIMPLRRLSGAVRGRLRRIARRCKGENG